MYPGGSKGKYMAGNLPERSASDHRLGTAVDSSVRQWRPRHQCVVPGLTRPHLDRCQSNRVLVYRWAVQASDTGRWHLSGRRALFRGGPACGRALGGDERRVVSFRVGFLEGDQERRRQVRGGNHLPAGRTGRKLVDRRISFRPATVAGRLLVWSHGGTRFASPQNHLFGRR